MRLSNRRSARFQAFRSRRARTGLLCAALTSSACTGILGGSDNAPSGAGTAGNPAAGTTNPDGSTPGGDFVPGAEPIALPLARVWRLTPLQYERAFTDAFGMSDKTAADFVVDPRRQGFDDVAPQNHVDIQWARTVQQNAASVAKKLALKLQTEQPCLFQAAPSGDCVGTFVEGFAARAFRRPLETTQKAAFVALFDEQLAGGNSAAESVAGVLESIAQSPHFLYRLELGEASASGVQTLDPYTLASQLAFMFSDGPPDAALLEQAKNGRLLERAVVHEQGRRLLETPQALQKVTRFFDQYLGTFVMRDEPLAKDANAYPDFTPEIQTAMLNEVDRFVAKVAFTKNGTLRDLFTAPQTYVADDLRAYYGWPGTAAADVAFAIPNQERAGLFLQGAVLSAHSQSLKTDALHRGLYIYERLLCQHIAPPADVDVFALQATLETPDPLSTEREKLAYFKAQNPVCGACHSVFVGLGLSLENYDAVGRYRTEQNARAIDPSGELALEGGASGPYAGAPELLGRIADSAQGQACFVQNWVSYALGDAFAVPTSSRLVAAFREQQLKIQDLLLQVTQEDAFYLRRVEEQP